MDRDLVNFDTDSELNNRLRCVLCTNIESFNILHHSKYNRKFRF